MLSSTDMRRLQCWRLKEEDIAGRGTLYFVEVPYRAIALVHSLIPSAAPRLSHPCALATMIT